METLSVSLSHFICALAEAQRRRSKARLITINLILFALCLPLRCLLLCATEILLQFQIYQIINKVSKQPQPQPSQRPCSLYGGQLTMLLSSLLLLLFRCRKRVLRGYMGWVCPVYVYVVWPTFRSDLLSFWVCNIESK